MTNEPRLRALLPIWPWLPAFRAVAETEHLPTAARLVGATPSSLSRGIAQLERRLKQPLFTRNGRTLRLNDHGRALLDAVRDAMRRCDDGLRLLEDPMLHGPLTIGSHGAGTTAFVAPALQRLMAEHPRLSPRITTPLLEDIRLGLRSGKLDIAFVETPLEAKELVTRRVGTLPRSIWCGPQHELFGRDELPESVLEEAGFLAPPDDAEGRTNDGWPATRRRRIVVTVDQIRVAVELCQRLPLLAVLPDALAGERGARLRRLPFDLAQPSEVYAIHRRSLSTKQNPVSALLAAL